MQARKHFLIYFLLSICVLLCSICWIKAAKHKKSSNFYDNEQIEQFFYKSSEENDDNNQQQRATIFREGDEYVYQYDAQIATGLFPLQAAFTEAISGQKAVTRMQARVLLRFDASDQATLQLEQVKIAALNDDLPSQSIGKMEMFESKQLSGAQQTQLKLPAMFSYTGGVVERIKFHRNDEVWSKNLKRAVLNMIQMKALKRSNHHRSMSASNGRNSASAFSTTETTVEGECQMLYSVNEIGQKRGQKFINVTKSIAFDECNKLPDVSFGGETAPMSPNRLRRSTVMQFTLAEMVSSEANDGGDGQRWMTAANVSEHFTLQRTELSSQYTLKSLSAEAGSAMHAKVGAELIFRSVRNFSPSTYNNRMEESEWNVEEGKSRYEELMFDNQWDMDVARFYAHGDEAFVNDDGKVTSPFSYISGNIVRAEQAFRRLARTMIVDADSDDKMEVSIHHQSFVETLRMLSMPELKQLDKKIGAKAMLSGHFNSAAAKVAQRQFFLDALANAGTRNTVALFVEKIILDSDSENGVDAFKAAQSLLSLQGLPTPSESIIASVQKLAKSDVVAAKKSSSPLKQAAWLIFGALVNELCVGAPSSIRTNSKEAFRDEKYDTGRRCSSWQQEKYTETILELWNSAQDIDSKILALKVIGNSRLPTMLSTLREVINNADEPLVARTLATVATYSISQRWANRAQMAKKVHAILLPVLMNARELPVLRISAFELIMKSRPNRLVIDQIAMALQAAAAKEKHKSTGAAELLTFAYNRFKVYSKMTDLNRNFEHLQNTLKLLAVDENRSPNCHAHFSLNSGAEKEGIFGFFDSLFSDQKQNLPFVLGTQFHALLNNEFHQHAVSLWTMQTGAESVLFNKAMMNSSMASSLGPFQRLFSSFFGGAKQQRRSTTAEAPATSTEMPSSFEWRQRDYTDNSGENDDDPGHASIHMRLGDVDQFYIPINIRNEASIWKKIKGALHAFMNVPTHKSQAMTISKEKRASIATSLGLPLGTMQALQLIAMGDFHATPSASSSMSRPTKELALKTHLKVNAAHLQKLKVWLPILTTGVQSIRAANVNCPLKMSIKWGEIAEAAIALPTSTTPLFGVQTLPTTYVTSAPNSNDGNVHLQQKLIKTINHPENDWCPIGVNAEFFRSIGLPFLLRGQFHHPMPPSYKQIVEALMGAENHIQLVFKPLAGETPHTLIIHADLAATTKMGAAAEKKHLAKFASNFKYSDFHAFSAEWHSPQNHSHFQAMPSRKQQREKLMKTHIEQALDDLPPLDKCSLKLTTKAVGGSKGAITTMEIQLTGSGKELDQQQQQKWHNFDGIDLLVEHFQTHRHNNYNNNGDNKWTLKASSRCLRPVAVNSAAEFSELLRSREGRGIDKRQLFAFAKIDWGRSEDKRQHMGLRVRGKHSLEQLRWQKKHWLERANNKLRPQQSAPFLNKFDIVAEHKFQPSWSNFLNQFLSVHYNALKTRYFWNTQTDKSINSSADMEMPSLEGKGKDNIVHAKLTIDTITRRHANLSIKTPSEVCRIEMFELPIRLRRIPLKMMSKDDKIKMQRDGADKQDNYFDNEEQDEDASKEQQQQPAQAQFHSVEESDEQNCVFDEICSARDGNGLNQFDFDSANTPTIFNRRFPMSDSELLKKIDRWIEEHNINISGGSGEQNVGNIGAVETKMKGLLEWVTHQFGLGERPPCLPQDASAEDRVKRKRAVEAQRQEYIYSYNEQVPHTPVLKPKKSILADVLLEFELPAGERPTLEWRRITALSLLKILNDVGQETIMNAVFLHPKKVLELFKLIAIPNKFDARPKQISDYNIVFNELQGLPQSASEYQRDEAFVRWRLAGPNPMAIQKCTEEMLEKKLNLGSLPLQTQATIRTAFGENRLFAVDYSILAPLKAGKNGDYQKYNVAPIALFQIPTEEQKRKRQWLEPVAIQCDAIDQSRRKEPPPMFTPNDGIKWTIAKATLNSADGDWHEGLVHLGLHLLMEPFVIAMHRQLPPVHPVYILLLPHFEGTCNANRIGLNEVFNDGGMVDHLVNQELKGFNNFIGLQVLDMLNDDFSFPAQMSRKGVDETNLPVPYPFRDDGMLLWKAISQWVEDYLRVYYGADDTTATAKIAADFELKAWIDELRSDNGGRVGWMKKFDGTFAMLHTVLTSIIFTASAQHAAVHFPEEQLLSYPPAYPLGLYKPPPNGEGQTTEADYLDTLPPLQMAFVQKKIMYILTEIFYTQIGHFHSRHFVDDRVQAPLKKFQQALENIESEIKQRNTERTAAWGEFLPKGIAQNWAYEYLLPSRVPQSINI